MKRAHLILANGDVVHLQGRFVLITETAGPKPLLGCVEHYKDGRERGMVICDTPTDVLDVVASIIAAGRRKPRAARPRKPGAPRPRRRS